MSGACVRGLATEGWGTATCSACLERRVTGLDISGASGNRAGLSKVNELYVLFIETRKQNEARLCGKWFENRCHMRDYPSYLA